MGSRQCFVLFSSFRFLKHYFTTYLYIMYGLIDTYHRHFGVSEMGWESWIRILASLLFLS